ncbi:hypothetical protein GCM10010260_05230 [Streptomyces filipinensis]|uniref:Uncharacterized protein n=1 Tax=Streptomyces filipinensis TaxID=66887 RepID=A0A918I648_9ACTN|nr:hypothetical protein [Streptomyces filipinensis]GGU76019.1 hypothetical protein GCM10010260_05230 [Streptomyces filipinensis]
MDAELMTLASTAGTTVVTLLTTDAWERARTAVAALWGRAVPDRVDTVEAELLETRDLLLGTGEQTGSGTPGFDEGIAEWRGKFRRLLHTRPELAQELRRILDEELTPALPAPAPAAPVVFHANPTGNARVYQAGRDQNFHER